MKIQGSTSSRNIVCTDNSTIFMVFLFYFASYIIIILLYFCVQYAPSQAVHQYQINTNFCVAFMHLTKFHHHVKVDQILIQKLS